MIVNTIQERHRQNPTRPSMPLDMYHEGDQVVILAVRGGKGVVRRLKEMGLGIGVNVRIVKNHCPGGLVLEVMDSKLCIGHGVARKIRAEAI